MNKSSGDDREMQVWHPIEDIHSLAEHLFRTVDAVPFGTRDEGLRPGNRAPEQKLSLAESGKGFVVRVELPDVQKKDVRVDVAEKTVTIFARWAKERKWKANEGSERAVSSEQLYSETLQLPATVKADQVKATFRDRVLKIVLPRAKPSQVRRIDVE